MAFSASELRRSRTVRRHDVQLETEGRSSTVGRGACDLRVMEGVRGQRARMRQASGQVAEPAVNLYAEELAAHSFQLREHVRSGIACEMYRVSRLPRERRDVIASSQAATAVGIRKLPVQCSLISNRPIVHLYIF